MRRSAAVLVVMLAVAGVVAAYGDDLECVAGLPSSPIKIEVFSDFQCPSCRTFYLETIRPVIENYARFNRVSIYYYDFPLAQHPYARQAARFAVAARKLGRAQWAQVTDALYSEQALWSADGKVEAAVARSLSPEDLAKAKKLMENHIIDEEIERAIMIGNSRGVTSTPTFFVTAGGREQRVVGGVAYPILKNFLDQNAK
jgi:protein-disulfide isomerase